MWFNDKVLKDKLYARCKRKNYDIGEVEKAQKKIAHFEIVKYISQNRIYFQLPNFGDDYHHL